MNKKCKICGNDFYTVIEEKDYCSGKCHLIYIQSEEFDEEINNFLGINSEKWLKQQIKLVREKISIYTNSDEELNQKLREKIGVENWNNFIITLNKKDEKSDNI